ncbi:MAG: glycosyltransferase, partial [Gemmatimonadota bacterium]
YGPLPDAATSTEYAGFGRDCAVDSAIGINEVPGEHAFPAVVDTSEPRTPTLRNLTDGMRITHYLSHFRLAEGGVVRAVLDFCEVLAQRGHDVTVLTSDATDVPGAWKSAVHGRPRLIRLEPPARTTARFTPSDRALIDRTVASSDVLHIHTPWDRTNLTFARAALRHGVPYVLTVHGMLDDWSMDQKPLKKRLYLALSGRRLLEQAAFVHCTAQGELDQAEQWFPEGRGTIAPYIFDLAPFRVLPGPELARRSIPAADVDEPTILFLSRLHHKKQPEVLIDAAAILREEGRAFRVLVAGTGTPEYEAALRQQVLRRGLEDVVHFVGLVLGQEKVSLYERADVFSLPTSQENFGFVLAESLAASTPVVTTKGTDIWRELESSGGAVITEGDAESTARGIAALLDDPALARRMGEVGRAWILDALDPGTIGAKFEALYLRARD